MSADLISRKKFPLDHVWDSLGADKSGAYTYSTDDTNSIHSSQEEAARVIENCPGIPLHGMHVLGFAGGKVTERFGNGTVVCRLGETDLYHAICRDDKFSVEIDEPTPCTVKMGGLTVDGLFEVKVTIWKLMRPDSGLAMVAIRGSAVIKIPGVSILTRQKAG
jgi:hypothetical protein